MNADLANIKRFLRLDPDAQACIARLGSRALGHRTQLLERFYAHVARFEETRVLLGDSENIQRLTKAQSEYFQELFSGPWDDAFAQRRYAVGHAHFAIGLEPKWYLGGYAFYITSLLELVGDVSQDELSSLLALLSLDISLTLEAYDSRKLQALLSEQRDRESCLPKTYRDDISPSDAVSPLDEPTDEPVVTSITTRGEFFGIHENGIGQLAGLWTVMEPRLHGILDTFYQHLETVPELYSFFPDASFVERLKVAQYEYWRRFFCDERDESYARMLYRVGLAHHNIGVPMQPFLGALLVQLGALASVVRTVGNNGVMRSLIRAVFYDASVVLDAYMDVRVSALQQVVDIEQVVANLPSGVIVVDQTLTVLSANQAAIDTVEFSSELILGNQLNSVFDTGHAIGARVRNVIFTGVAQRDVLVSAQQAHGRRDFRISITPLIHEQEKRAVIVLDDVTNVKTYSTAAGHLERRYHLLLNDVNAVLWEVAPDGGLPTILSGRWESVVGFSREEMLFRDGLWRERVHPQDRPHIDAAIARLSHGATNDVSGLCRVVRADGECRWFHYHVQSDTVDRHRVFRGVAVDVTVSQTAKAQEYERTKLSLLTRMAAGAAHDFGNALHMISNAGDTALELDCGEPVRRYLTMILDTVAHASAVAQDMMNVIRLDPPPKELLELTGLVARAIQIGGYDDVMLVDRGARAPVVVEAPLSWIERCVVNLIRNARDASERDAEVEVHVDRVSLEKPLVCANRQLEPGDYGRIQVMDHGTGIAESLRSSVFEPFFTTKPQQRGTGIGLTTVVHIMNELCGGVALEPRPTGGTIAILWFPLSVSQNMPQLNVTQSGEAPV